MRGNQLAPSPVSSPVEGEEVGRLGVGFGGGAVGETGLSSLQTDPPTLPEMIRPTLQDRVHARLELIKGTAHVE
jgi:hypothetical protein